MYTATSPASGEKTGEIRGKKPGFEKPVLIQETLHPRSHFSAGFSARTASDSAFLAGWMVVELALFGASGAGDRAVGAIGVRTLFHRPNGSSASVFAFAAEANTFFHACHALAGIAALLACVGADSTVFDAFLHRYFHLHAAYYAA